MQEIYLPDQALFKWMDGSGTSTNWANNCVWIEITPKTLVNQSNLKTTSVTVEDITGDDSIRRYSFLAPKEMQETINHVWDPMENIQSVISQKLAGGLNALNQSTHVYKVDTPLLYKDSSRKAPNFLFSLVYTGISDPYSEVIEPIKNLIKWSSPILPGGNISAIGEGLANLDTTATVSAITAIAEVQIPYVFTLRSKTGDGKSLALYNIKAAALKSVQPVYMPPYIDGYPTRADVSLQFEDIEPLNRATSFRTITVNG